MPKSLILLLFLFTSPAWAEGVPQARIVVIRNADHLSVERKENGKIKTLTVKEGDSIAFDSIVRAPENGSAWISFPDGSLVQIQEHGSIQIRQPADGQQKTDLLQGRLRALIKRKLENAQSEQRSRFVIRTKTMILGVRGTDFVVDFAESTKKASVHTLEGTVTAAASDETLDTGESVFVHGGEALDATPAGLSKVHKFDVQSYQQLMEAPPELEASEAAPVSADSGPALRVLSFQLGIMQSNLGGPPGTVSPFLAWEPNLRLFSVGFISLGVRGRIAFGGSFSEFNAFLSASLFNFIFGEAGGGTQYGAGANPTSDMRVFRLGIILSQKGLLNRIYVGHADLFPQYTSQTAPVPIFENFQVGVGFQI